MNHAVRPRRFTFFKIQPMTNHGLVPNASTRVLAKWRSAWVAGVLKERDVPLSLLEGIHVTNADVAKKSSKQAAMWSKILPFIIVIWSLTGAFYPAIDLCAGEKERGTFETLLSSPAARSEIAIGKLLTVMSFSMATSLLNLLSMGFTGVFVAGRLSGGMGLTNTIPIGVPPLESFVWLVIAMIPISALFTRDCPGSGRICPQQQRRTILSRPADDDFDAVDDGPHVTGRSA